MMGSVCPTDSAISWVADICAFTGGARPGVLAGEILRPKTTIVSPATIVPGATDSTKVPSALLEVAEIDTTAVPALVPPRIKAGFAGGSAGNVMGSGVATPEICTVGI